MTKTVSFINYKGGVGKSTTAYHVACSLALDHGKKVLVVDVDPQTNLTFLCAVPQRWKDFKRDHGTLLSLFSAHLEGRPFQTKDILWSDPVQKNQVSVVPGLDLIPSDLDLLDADLGLQIRPPPAQDFRTVSRHYVDQRTIIRKALEQVSVSYEYIFIDCPPNLYLITQNALAASDSYVVTALPDHLSTIGMQVLMDKTDSLNSIMSHALAVSGAKAGMPQLGGIIFVKVRQSAGTMTNVHANKMAELHKLYDPMVFDRCTVEGIGYSEAALEALPVFLTPGSNPSRVREHYRDIAQEFIEKVPP